MEHKTEPKRLLAALAGRAVSPPPIWLMRQAGRYLPEYQAIRQSASGFLEMCYTPDLAVEVTLQPIRRYGFDAAILFSDILVVPHALGADLAFVQGEGPKLAPIRDAAGIRALSGGRLHDHLAPVYETVRRLRTELPAETTLIGFAGAPWTLAAYMVEGQGSKEWLHPRRLALEEPDTFQELIDRLTDAVIAYLARQAEAGAEALQVFDSWAGVLPPEQFRRWCVEPLRRVVEGVRARAPGVPILAFPRGAGPHYVEFAQTVRPDGLSLDTTVPTAWARDHLPDGVCLQGNLDPVTLLAGGSALDQAVDRIKADLVGRPHIFNLGHGVLPPTDPDHVARLMERVRS